jgi:hypothetical protein
MIYQLRLPVSLGLDGFFARIVRTLEQSLGRPLDLRLQNAVARDLERHILAYDTCGCSALCDEASVPARWNQGYDPLLLSTKPGDADKVLRLQLKLPQDSLEVFTGALARFVDGRLEGGNASRREAAAKALQELFAPHLFVGEICHKTDLCQMAEPRPVSITVEARA